MRRVVLAMALLLGCAAAGAAPAPRVLILGFDGMDPRLVEQFRAEGEMPNFDRFLAAGGQLTEFGTSTPPQSPVAWSNFITGRDPGGHGIFDFIHRDPETLLPFFSTSEAKGPTRFFRIGDWKVPRDAGEVRNLRQGRAFWELLADAGVDVTIFKVPSNFPPVECEARSLSGMGTPDITGNYGVSTLITDDPPVRGDVAGGRIEAVLVDDGHFTAQLLGPRNTWREGDPEATVPVRGTVDRDRRAVWLDVDGTAVVLDEGQWSGWVQVSFSMVPLLKSVRGICRFYLIEAAPALRIYVTPVQIDPLEPEMPISTPSGYSRELAEAVGLYYTQGLPDDTSALENGFLSDDQYVQQSDLVLQERTRELRYELDRFSRLESGLLFFYYNSPDQTCHMCWRNMDPGSPTHDASDPAHAERIRDVYRELDAVLGLVLDRVGEDTVVMVMSDHGFAPWNRAFHVNRWLYDEGYLVLKNGVAPADVDLLHGVDWTRTRAYALGINGLYVNLAGREARGIVSPGAERQALVAELAAKLEAVVDPLDGRRAIKHADRSDVVYEGPLAQAGPDIVIGYFRGWRGSNESALGQIPDRAFGDNMLKWSGDHCIAADEVPGILMANRPIRRADPALVDMAPTILTLFGVTPPAEMVGGDLFSE